MNVVVCLGADSDERSDAYLAASVALARRLVDETGEGQVVAVAWGPRSAAVRVRMALALAADNGIVAPAESRDGVGEREALVAMTSSVSPDLVITAHDRLASGLARLLRMPCVADVVDVSVSDRTLLARAGRGGGVEEVAGPLPAVIALAPPASEVIAVTPRCTFAQLVAARTKPVKRLTRDDLGSPPASRPDSSLPPPKPVRPTTKLLADEEGHVAIMELLERSGVIAPAPAPTRQPVPRPLLAHAGVVVAGGRGLGDAAGFAMVVELARLLGAAPAASGGAVASGWAPRSLLVGQTATKVRPDLYLSFGISGASQHLAGLEGTPCIVAVNEDPASSIFSVADIAVVAEPRRVLARLLAELSA